MKRLWTGSTVRHEVIQFASIRREFEPGMAIEHICDGWDQAPPSSIKYKMGVYVRDISDAAWKRLVRDVSKARGK